MEKLSIIQDKIEETLDTLQERYAISDKDYFMLISTYADRIAVRIMEDYEILKRKQNDRRMEGNV
jgi:hypothetical protein